VRTGYNWSDRLVAPWEAPHFLLPWYGEQDPEVVRRKPSEELPPPEQALAGKGRVICHV